MNEYDNLNAAEKDICPTCGKKLYDGTPVHSVRMMHWDCLPEVVKNPPTVREWQEETEKALKSLENLEKKVLLLPSNERRQVLNELKRLKIS